MVIECVNTEQVRRSDVRRLHIGGIDYYYSIIVDFVARKEQRTKCHQEWLIFAKIFFAIRESVANRTFCLSTGQKCDKVQMKFGSRVRRQLLSLVKWAFTCVSRTPHTLHTIDNMKAYEEYEPKPRDSVRNLCVY